MADEKKQEAPKPAAGKAPAGKALAGKAPAGKAPAAAPAAAPKAGAAAPAAAAAAAPAPEVKKQKPSARHMGTAKAARRRLRKKKSQIQARRKKEFTYRGHTLEELLELPMADIIELLPARARRTYIRGLNSEQESFVRRLRASDKPVRTHRREIPILPEFVGKTVQVYNGKEFSTVEIRAEMIGHYLGEFALTRKSVRHSGLGVGATRSSKFMPLK
jgi:small subunit ribosomal protein S19|nr:SSU ribosomal protein S15e S19p [uncultured archaeon]